MDANGSRFHLLLGRDDWAECTVDGTKLRNIWRGFAATDRAAASCHGETSGRN